MTHYLINHNCIYNEDSHEIKNTENAFTIKMTAMRARCLSFIIENAPNGIIEKEQLTTALWGSRGKYVSDANLTQLLYLIRKDLKTLGINSLFITIPRQGIKVNKQIPISPIEEKKSSFLLGRWRLVLIGMLATSLLALGAVAEFIHIN